MVRSGLLMLALAAVGCQRGEGPAAPPASAGSAAASGAAPGSTAASVATAPADRTDPGPQLKREAGRVEPKSLPPVALDADACGKVRGAWYCELPMPDDLSKLPAGVLLRGRLRVRGDRYALAVPAGEGRVRDRPLAMVRFTGAQALPDQFTIDWLQPSTGHEPGARAVIEVSTGSAEARGELDLRFYEAAHRWFRARGVVGFERQDLFSTFAAGRFEHLANQARPPERRRPRQASRSDLANTMALYTGLTSVEEALQADRGLNLPPEDYRQGKTPLADIKGVDLPGHPWPEMIAELGKEAVIEPLAAYAPNDQLYLHFHDLRTLVGLADDLDELVRPVGRVLEERSGTRDLAGRYERQLGVERLGLAKTLGHVAAKGVALLAADPFLRDGADVSVLFHLRNRAILVKALESYEARTRQRRPDVKVETLTLAGKPVRRLFTDDGEVNQYRLDLGDEVLAVTNSQGAAEALLAVQADPTLSLAQAGEFQYFRALYPFAEDQEDGFAFLSDRFVGHAVSPTTKVLQGRRMAAWSALMAVNQAALLYGWLEGERPRSAQDLVDAGLLDKGQLAHVDGSPIRFDPQTGASSKWGRVSGMAPLSAWPRLPATANEAGAYERFRETYRNYWRGFIDPIGVRIQRKPDGKTLALDARMLPLLQGSDYNRLARDVGDARITPGPSAEGLRLVLGVGKDAGLRRTLGELGRATSGSRDLGLDWLGEWVMVGTADRSGLWDAALSLGEVPGTHGPGAFGDGETRKKVINRMPLYAGAHVAQPLALAGALTALKALAQSAAPGMLTWEPTARYRDVDIVTVQEKFEGPGIAVHYAVAKGVFLLAFERATLEAQLDAVLDGQIPKAAAAGDARDDNPQSLIEVRPAAGDGWLARTLLGLTEWANLRANRAALFAWEDLIVGMPGLPEDPAARDAVAKAWLGYTPASAHGGIYRQAPGGEVEHSVYGSEVAPSWPELPVADSPVTAFTRQLAELTLSVSFEGEGRTRGLRTRLSWTRR
ncbi:MAG: hypothetical protein KC613_19595 [Myxococcales bacterium]|nr:hypothetical protein [Myxococcales bacterium]MCB9526459.1 hypothetical protein [Myxococcales bacterium]